ncbi:PorP/SprF family type IX secretion system membrane protein [Flammeovirga yaeyamensis]|uniref:PorP/SprF family type IX secretion system membrane protein n=1 Tax=Flammeovirga yaeyamensis TaxID=367791 RepID=A0AAX1N6T0_9BACT|nr:type IX secretion system membrane protein PorP/SprF [Flammeovirga yaeyamensis]MBB3697769.1 type IX secretion system PorP/SprF family membrane protein [Flammeovirga yaeyamensis]NMF35875.1 type IX secretion system membrane protein PorP/SprF [Flammeovirga yaeyamensis]QWG03175.1 PorP/SprF family type IX secretion system membrane protein [Flammeovirga yaeyamensis]
MKKCFAIVWLLMMALFHQVKAQQTTLYSQYMFNGLTINPAYAGSQGGVNTSLIYRQHWTGVGGSPNTTTLAIDSPLGNKRMSIGGLFSQDKIGATTTQNMNVVASYRINLFSGTLSFGLQGGFNSVAVNFADLTSFLPDPALPDGTVRRNSPNFGAGLFYNTDHLYLGFSAPRLISSDLGDPNSTLVVEEKRHYFLNAGYAIELSHLLMLKPNILFRLTEGAPLQADINLNALIMEWIWFGVSYRTQESFALLTEIQLSKVFRIGYSYDMITNSASNITNGSHEFVINVFFENKKKKIKTPRYF